MNVRSTNWMTHAFCKCGHHQRVSFNDVWFARNETCPDCGEMGSSWKIRTFRTTTTTESLPQNIKYILYSAWFMCHVQIALAIWVSGWIAFSALAMFIFSLWIQNKYASHSISIEFLDEHKKVMDILRG